MINTAVDTVSADAAAKGIAMDVDIDPSVRYVTGDSDRLQQVIWNLLSNSIKFTPQNGQVQVRVRQVDSHAEISVRDTGQGISQTFLPYVFDRFRQAEADAARQQGGLGLGLAIVRHLVEAHGGRVWAESPGEGLGSSFIVRLPVPR